MAFASAFASVPLLDTKVYLWGSRYGSDTVLQHTARHAEGKMTLLESGKFTREAFDVNHQASPAPDLLVSITCKRDLLIKGGALDYLLTDTNTTLLCVVHHSDKWIDRTSVHFRLAGAWMRRNRIKFITLSPHVTEALKAHQVLSRYTIETFVPTFVPPPFCKPPAEDAKLLSRGHTFISLQGNFQAKRRNYNATFQGFQQFHDMYDTDDKYRLVVLGNGESLDVPVKLQDKVLLRPDLNYAEYYGILSHSMVILPAFANDAYVETTASSTVAVASIVGVPLMADERLVDAYSYLDEDEVYMRSKDETEMQALSRIVKMPASHHNSVAAQMKAKREILAMVNSQLVQTWADESIELKQEGIQASLHYK